MIVTRLRKACLAVGWAKAEPTSPSQQLVMQIRGFGCAASTTPFEHEHEHEHEDELLTANR